MSLYGAKCVRRNNVLGSAMVDNVWGFCPTFIFAHGYMGTTDFRCIITQQPLSAQLKPLRSVSDETENELLQ